MESRKLRFALLIDYLVTDYSECILKGVTDFCNVNDIELFILPIGTICAPSTDNNYLFATISSHVNPENFDGVIMTSGTQQLYASKDYLEKFIKYFRPVPVVNISIKMPGITAVVLDTEPGFRTLIEHLINEHGCRRFGLMGVRGNSSEVRERTELFKMILMENDISLEDTVFWEAGFEYLSAKNQLEKYISACKGKPKLDAIVALNDEMAFGCIDCAKSHGLNVPKDIKIVGFDDVTRATYACPSLTTVSQELQMQGYESAHALYQKINKEPVEDVIVIPTKAIIRHSCGCNSNRNHQNTETLFYDHKVNYEKSAAVASEWYTKRSQIIQATNFYTSATAGMTMEKLKEIINGYIRSFDISSAAIVLYNEPKNTQSFVDHFEFPDDAYIFSFFDTKRNQENEPDSAEIVFNPKECILPKGIIEFEAGGFFIFALYHSNTQFGYIVFKRGSYDLTCYDILARSISALISSAVLFTENQRRQTLEDERFNRLDIISRTDELTGLLNRRGFLNLAGQAMNLAESMNQKGLVLYCDMDGLKQINDTFGHDSGDEAIKAEASILRSCFRQSDIIGRIGGDEFAVVCTGLGEKEFAKIRKSIDKGCQEWGRKNKSPFELSISVGFQTFPMPKTGYKISFLMSEADASLYVEKRNKKEKKIIK